ncbi:ABC transporter ATP-binding protein [Stackebrandtia nassauensis]|uniref:Oligopeptide/dipeptide ABC transporter, ATPase subunit n=1 Tax=Stackebrandtia nassauensis (strain DSM 44728 / CIP 108903 / NRRL B-16338 / NBRC 102104 / LLR-40K-21) TaxID=446470 RepID=D3Q141_STANL|nr:dipeptide ABC transporter ATP-binding protein [Stackebrandtia nassauensis]ADD43791.1 oligopeptide/dipeptide ABC transporter, ATPase subunit [Stackebrandtia nassauensis DSM 44728]
MNEPTTVAAGTAAAGETVLEVDNLVKHFPIRAGVVFKKKIGAVKAVDGVSLSLRKGETLGVVGESGCGKSTLAKLLVGLERPTSGGIRVKGEDITRLGRKGLHRLRRNVQMVFQDPYTSLNPRMTVGDIIGEPFVIHPDVVPKSGRRKAIQDLLDVVGLNPDHINRYPHQFSGGQRQRIGIARALALKPEILLCDEPVSALDVSIQGQVINLLEELQDELGLSYIFIAHDLSVVRHIADRVAVMYLGSVAELGTEDEIYESPMHPYTQALLSAVPVPDPKAREHKAEIILEGDVPSPANPPSGCRFRTRCFKARQEWAKTATPEQKDSTSYADQVPDNCRDEQPLLQIRPGADHPNACHYAAPRDVLHAA